MCLGGGGDEPEVHTPAAAPAAPEAPPEEPGIGDQRRRENRRNFGNPNGPEYRIRDDVT